MLDDAGDGTLVFLSGGADNLAIANDGRNARRDDLFDHAGEERSSASKSRPWTNSREGLKRLMTAATRDGEVAAGVVEIGGQIDLAGAGQADDVVDGDGPAQPLRHAPGKGGIAGHGFEAADVAAAAAPAIGDDGDVADLAGQAAVPGEQPAAGDDAEADAGVDVEHGEVVEAARLAVVLLAEAEGVRLLEQDALDAELAREIEGGRSAIGQGDDWATGRRAGCDSR